MQRIRFDESLVGTVVEKDFTIVEYLGAGANGATYRARQQTLARDVCIKFLAVSSLSDAENVRRFKREARVLARLKHKNIVECYAFGIFERVYPFW
ncbi:MAG: protein kinase [Candidatus Obscuribacterales bacterium]|nr:protein kinase [Candidatus Obscuribacterales bacterium]